MYWRLECGEGVVVVVVVRVNHESVLHIRGIQKRSGTVKNLLNKKAPTDWAHFINGEALVCKRNLPLIQLRHRSITEQVFYFSLPSDSDY